MGTWYRSVRGASSARHAEGEEDDSEGGKGDEDARRAAEGPRDCDDRHGDPDRLPVQRELRVVSARYALLDAAIDLLVDALQEAGDQVLLVLRPQLLPRGRRLPRAPSAALLPIRSL